MAYIVAAALLAWATIVAVIVALFMGRDRMITALRRHQQEAAIRAQVHGIVAGLERHDAGECSCYEFDVEEPFVDAEFARIAAELDEQPYDQEQP